MLKMKMANMAASPVCLPWSSAIVQRCVRNQATDKVRDLDAEQKDWI